jgi:hypothetical protein
MTNGFSVQPGALPDAAVVLAAAGSALRAVQVPHKVAAGRSTDEVAAAVLQLIAESTSLGEALTELGAAYEAAARSYVAADDAVAAALTGWGD